MTQREESVDPASNLRDKAEAKLALTTGVSTDLTGKTLEEIIHELRVYQIGRYLDILEDSKHDPSQNVLS